MTLVNLDKNTDERIYFFTSKWYPVVDINMFIGLPIKVRGATSFLSRQYYPLWIFKIPYLHLTYLRIISNVRSPKGLPLGMADLGYKQLIMIINCLLTSFVIFHVSVRIYEYMCFPYPTTYTSSSLIRV